MAKDEFDLGNLLGGLKSGIDSLKETMTTQHGAFNVKLDMLIDRHAVTDKKVDKAHDRIDDITDPENGILASLKKTANQALEYGEDYNDNKKKVIWGGSILVGIGAGLSWLIGILK